MAEADKVSSASPAEIKGTTDAGGILEAATGSRTAVLALAAVPFGQSDETGEDSSDVIITPVVVVVVAVASILFVSVEVSNLLKSSDISLLLCVL